MGRKSLFNPFGDEDTAGSNASDCIEPEERLAQAIIESALREYCTHRFNLHCKKIELNKIEQTDEWKEVVKRKKKIDRLTQDVEFYCSSVRNAAIKANNNGGRVNMYWPYKACYEPMEGQDEVLLNFVNAVYEEERKFWLKHHEEAMKHIGHIRSENALSPYHQIIERHDKIVNEMSVLQGKMDYHMKFFKSGYFRIIAMTDIKQEVLMNAINEQYKAFRDKILHRRRINGKNLYEEWR